MGSPAQGNVVLHPATIEFLDEKQIQAAASLAPVEGILTIISDFINQRLEFDRTQEPRIRITVGDKTVTTVAYTIFSGMNLFDEQLMLMKLSDSETEVVADMLGYDASELQSLYSITFLVKHIKDEYVITQTVAWTASEDGDKYVWKSLAALLTVD